MVAHTRRELARACQLRQCRWLGLQVDADAIGHQGSVEHLRHLLDKTTDEAVMSARSLYWMSDTTPHEGLPLTDAQTRVYFRLVVGKLSLWYTEHNTPNPLGVLPDAQIVHGDKFSAKDTNEAGSDRERAQYLAAASCTASWDEEMKAAMAAGFENDPDAYNPSEHYEDFDDDDLDDDAYETAWNAYNATKATTKEQKYVEESAVFHARYEGWDNSY